MTKDFKLKTKLDYIDFLKVPKLELKVETKVRRTN